jgi:class 3 adenylate cyclase
LGAYVWLALLMALLARDAEPAALPWAAVLVLPMIPSALAYAKRSLGVRASDIENVATPFLIGLLALPLLPNAAVIGALLTGAVAQHGWRGLPRCAVLVTAGWCAGGLSSSDIDYRAGALVDALCLAFIVLYTTPLCALGYEETMRMRRMRERLRAVSVDLERQRDRLSRYVAAPVAERLADPALTKAPLERRWLTVAFVDIADFTGLTERLEPEDLTTLLDEFFAGLAELSGSYRGNLHKFLGDGALISFGESRSEGRRIDAAACVAMLGQLPRLVDRLNGAARGRSIPAALAVRAGVASGYCTVGDFGADERIEYTMIGAPVNLASRLEGLAASGEVWVAQATRDLADADSFEALGALAVKGFDGPVPAFRLRVTASVDARHAAI